MEGGTFAYATDERTMETQKLKHQKRTGSTPSVAQMKAFVKHYYNHRGEKTVIARREVEEAPVLKPGKGMKYQFRA